jgi:hypothetical protein
MQVKISKVMCKSINDYLKAQKQFAGYKLKYIELKPNEYKYAVDYDIYENVIDYDNNKNMFKTIEIEYPANYYACNKYLTTNELKQAYKNCDKTYNSFMQAVANIIEI